MLSGADPIERRAGRPWHVVVAYSQRDWRVHFRAPLVVVGTLIGPSLLIVAVGVGLASSLGHGGQERVLASILPGLIGMAALLAASQRGVAVFGDKGGGLTDEILAGPTTRGAVVIAQATSSATIGLTHAMVIFLLSWAGGLATAPASWAAFLGILVIFAFSCSAACTGLALLAERPGTIQAILNLVVNPLFFLSGALFSLSTAPGWMRLAADLDPLHYGVELIQLSYGSPGSGLSAAQELTAVAVLVLTAALGIVLGLRALRGR